VRILLVCHRYPYPPNNGRTVRTFHVLEHFRKTGHQVTVASMLRSDAEAEEGRGLEAHVDKLIVERVREPAAVVRMAAMLPTATPSSMGYFYSKRLGERIGQELATVRYDLIFVYCSSVAQYVEDTYGIPMVLDFGDMDSQKWLSYGTFKPFPLSLGYFVEGLKLQFAEARLARRFDTCLATTPAEIKTLDGFLTGCRTDFYPNGVDAGVFQPVNEPYDPDTIAFIGRMDYYPNQKAMIDLCRDVLPLVHAKRPSAKLVIVGAEPSAGVRALERHRGVTVTGSVPKVQPYVLRSALTVAPLEIARGTQNKVLESLAMGVPAVVSPLAAGGVDAVPEEHLLVADRPEDYARQILRVLDDPALRARLSEAGRRRMITHHDWGRSMEKLDGIIRETVERVRGRGDPRSPLSASSRS
jgi:hypothetical protein